MKNKRSIASQSATYVPLERRENLAKSTQDGGSCASRGQPRRCSVLLQRVAMERQIVVGGANVSVLEDGEGEPTLFLHGNPDSKEIWKPVIERLNDRCHAFAPDLPGFGHSDLPADFDASLEAQACWVDEVIAGLGLRDPITLVVHDIGGPFGLAWAVSHPEKVKRLVIMNTTFNSTYRWHTWARVWRTPLLGEVSMAAMNSLLFAREMRRGSRNLTPEHIRETYARITPKSKRSVLRWYRAMDPPKFRGWDDRVAALANNVPTMVMWGDRDPYIDRTFAERFGARDVHHVDVGHWVQAEAPDDVAARIREHLVR
jgi:pimeloyl-ACP methyl ester carboxylesterase